MNRRQLSLGIATTAFAVAGQAQAQASRPVQPQIRSVASSVPADTRSVYTEQLGRLPRAIQADVRALYELTGWRPVWTPARLNDLTAIARKTENHGLASADFFDFVGLAADPSSSEVRTTAAAISYAKALAEGRVRPETVEELWEMEKNRVDLPTGLANALSSGQLVAWFDGLAPSDVGYTNLSAGYLRYIRLVRNGGWPVFRQGSAIEPGMSDARIAALIKRLVAEGDLTVADGARLTLEGLTYGTDLQAAVRSFQSRHGLLADGRIGPATQRSLGASTEDRARQIALNLERRRWLKRTPPPERIEVNTAAAIMVYWKDGRPVHSNRVIVGSPEHQTPSLEKPFASVMANPPWFVPASIARREILPRGPAYLAANNMYLSNGSVVQRAGPTAALGYVKFEMRDSYAIFLHDTPGKAAFNLAMRQRSHGCVRVQGAVEFARLLLTPEPELLRQFDATQTSRETRRVQMGRDIAVRLLYWTAFVDGQQRVAFREDVYKRDQKLAEALGIAVDLPDVVADGAPDTDDVGP
jgi:murein L,D-transpeptidase YcbB/YkuD